MADVSYFESRIGKPECSPEQIFYFVTDLRNFERFIPAGAIVGWKADIDTCSFKVPNMGDVTLSIVRKEPYTLVAYKGSALKNNDFEIVLHIDRNDRNLSDIKVSLNAELNPMMKMIASKPIGQFLGMVIDRIENFNCWDEIKE
jgi:hypothetical protein